jgi:hypothetical protein
VRGLQMSKEFDPILKKMNVLAEKIDVLTKVIACKPNSEQINGLLKKKSLIKQIHILKEWGFSNEIMASIIGTTPESVRVRLIQMKSKKKKENSPQEKEEGSEK